MNAYKDPITSKIPPEVASNIFIKFMEGSKSDCLNASAENMKIEAADYQWIPPVPLNQKPGAVASPLQLGAISQAWRKVVWSTPQLWTKIAVDVGAKNFGAVHVELFQRCLGQSTILPLAVLLLGRDVTQKPHSKAIIDAVRCHSNRLVVLGILGLPQATMESLHFDASARPKLEKLYLISPNLSTEKISINAIWDRLTHVTLEGLRLSHVGIEWTSVTHAKTRDLTMTDYFELLVLAPQLKQLVIPLLDDGYANFDSIPIIEHKVLQRFRLRTRECQTASAFLRKLAFPALEELHLDFGEEERDAWTLDTFFYETFTHSLACLKSLTLIEVYHLEYETLIEILETLPYLEYLELQVIEVDYPEEASDLLLERLATTGMDVPKDILLPNLKELYIHGSPSVSWELVPPIFAPFSISSSPPGLLQEPFNAGITDKTERQRPRILRVHDRYEDCDKYQDSDRYQDSDNDSDHECDVDREDVAKLVGLMDQGIIITVGTGSSPGKRLQSWIDFHHLSKT